MEEVELSLHVEKIHGGSNDHDKSGEDLDSNEGAKDCGRCDYLARWSYMA